MHEMRDSGIEWIGAIPTTWYTKKMKHISKFIQNKYSSDYGLLPYIGLENIASWSGGFISTNSQYDREQSLICEPEDILFGKLRPYLAKVYMNDRLCCCSNEFAVIRVNGQNKRYMWYQLLSHGFIFEIDRSTYGTKMPRANAEFIRNVFVALPSEIEQQKIANYLDKMCAEIDAVLEKTRASIEEYKKLKQAVITQAVTKGIRGDRPMKNSGIEWIGEIPAEWSVVRQKYFWNTIESGVSVNAADKPVDNSEQYGVLKTSAVSKFMFIPTEHKQVNLEEYGRVSCPVRADSIIASRMNTPELVGACGYVQNNYPNLFLPDRLWQITFKDELSPKYAWYYLSGIRVRQYISSLSTGTSSSMQNISQSQYGNIFITIPSIGEQSEIAKYLDEKCNSVDALIAKKQQYLIEIENYKKSLIYEYVTGKREV